MPLNNSHPIHNGSETPGYALRRRRIRDKTNVGSDCIGHMSAHCAMTTLDEIGDEPGAGGAPAIDSSPFSVVREKRGGGIAGQLKVEVFFLHGARRKTEEGT